MLCAPCQAGHCLPGASLHPDPQQGSLPSLPPGAQGPSLGPQRWAGRHHGALRIRMAALVYSLAGAITTHSFKRLLLSPAGWCQRDHLPWAELEKAEAAGEDGVWAGLSWWSAGPLSVQPEQTRMGWPGSIGLSGEEPEWPGESPGPRLPGPGVLFSLCRQECQASQGSC